MPTMSECIADMNRAVRQIRTLEEKRRGVTRKALRDGIEGDVDYWTGELKRCIDAIAGKLGEQYDWLGRNEGSRSYAEIWGLWSDGLEVYQDAWDYYERLPKRAPLEGAA